jgi:hypothetical protein
MLQYKNHNLDAKFPEATTFFSDANSAVRRSVLLGEVPYRDVSYAEDQLLGQDMLEAGYIKAYAPYGSVIHSHSYLLKKYFRRMVDEYAALKKIYPKTQMVSRKELVVGSLKSTYHDVRFILRDKAYRKRAKLKHLFYALPYNVARRLAGRIADSKSGEKMHARLSLEGKVRAEAAASSQPVQGAGKSAPNALPKNRRRKNRR